MAQYDSLSDTYNTMRLADPIKLFIQKPTALKLVGTVKGQSVLDIGCGDGNICRALAKKGARVVGYDISAEQIRAAKTKSQEFPSIQYAVATPSSFSFPKKFDKACAVLVLTYAKDQDELQAFFDSAFGALKKGGEFVVVDVDRARIPFDEIYFGRKQVLRSDGRVELTFVVPGTKPFSVVQTTFFREQFESCARKAGFKKILWKKLSPTAEGKRVMPKEYWRAFDKHGYFLAGIFKK